MISVALLLHWDVGLISQEIEHFYRLSYTGSFHTSFTIFPPINKIPKYSARELKLTLLSFGVSLKTRCLKNSNYGIYLIAVQI